MGREEDAWRLQPEGETEVPETVISADEVEGTYVDSYGESHHGRGKVKNHRSQSGVQGEEVREAKSTDQEEVEELSFVPCAINVPQKLVFRCAAKRPSASGSWRRW